MSQLDQLIQQLCPDGVEYKSINDLIKINIVKVITPTIKIKRNDYQSIGTTPIVSQDQEFISGYCNLMDKNIPKGQYVCFGDHSEHIKYVDFLFVQGADGLKIMKIDNLSILPKYFYYSIDNFYKRRNNYERHFKYLTDTIIPIPPLEIQQEIVRILDHFTELSAELTVELTARKKQYEYYRDALLTFTDTTPLAILGEVAVVTKLAGFEFTKYVKYSDSGNTIALRGLNVKNGRLDLTDVKYIDASDFSKLTRSKLHVGDMLFTYVGTIGQVALIDAEDKYYLAPNVALIRSVDKRLNPQYMRYYFQSNNFWKTQINKLLQSSSMQNIPMEKIRKFVIPLPSPEEQNHIVSILDKFDALCNDQTSGLPAEIAARQKQYEYYRDKLLTFPERKKEG